MGEYLASGRPILVHAPAESFIAEYCNKYNCGYVVDEKDPQLLVNTICEIILNPNKREIVSKNAIMRAQEDFSYDRFNQELLKICG